VSTAPLFTLGVEEEYQVIDARSGELSPSVEEVLASARAALGESAQHELLRSQVEAGTPVCTTLGEVRDRLVGMRRALLDAARGSGCRIAAAGTHPSSSWRTQETTPMERYRWLETTHRRLSHETLIFGCHVHVACGDPDTTIAVMNRCRPWLPVLLALSVSSPFFEGEDSGFSSYRTTVFRRWPTAGAPQLFASRAEFDVLVDDLERTGVIDDATRLYWDVRPSARYPTLEFRIADACPRLDDAVMIAGLTRALAETAHRAERAGEPYARVRPELLEAAIWRAARDGLGGELVDPVTVCRMRAATVVERCLDHVRPVLDHHGDADDVGAAVERLLRDGTSAARQRAAHRRRGRLADVVDLLVEETESLF
jgi:carboxylate-amine ligase